MQFNVAQLLKAPIGEQRQYSLDEPLPRLDDLHLTEPLTGTAKLTHVNQGIVASVHASSAMELACSRCLEPYALPFTLDFDETYAPSVDVHTGLPAEQHHVDPAGTFSIDEHHNLDLTEAVRQHALLAVPLMPLHDEDCAGLCPVCGVNLNDAPDHAHAGEPVDERLQSLGALLDEASSEGRPEGDAGSSRDGSRRRRGHST